MVHVVQADESKLGPLSKLTNRQRESAVNEHGFPVQHFVTFLLNRRQGVSMRVIM